MCLQWLAEKKGKRMHHYTVHQVASLPVPNSNEVQNTLYQNGSLNQKQHRNKLKKKMLNCSNKITGRTPSLDTNSDM
jgi:hypothetical protein